VEIGNKHLSSLIDIILVRKAYCPLKPPRRARILRVYIVIIGARPQARAIIEAQVALAQRGPANRRRYTPSVDAEIQQKPYLLHCPPQATQNRKLAHFHVLELYELQEECAAN